MKRSKKSYFKSVYSMILFICLLTSQVSLPANAAVSNSDQVGRPSHVAASATSSKADLSWSAPDGGAVPDGYFIYRNNELVGNITSGTQFADSGLAAGTSYVYKLQAYKASSLSEAVIVPVETGTIAGKQPPRIESVYPADGDAAYAAKSTIYFMASTSDSDGTVATVKYYNNGVLLGQSPDGKGIKSWYGVPQGNYSIAAVAVDNSGNTATKVFNISVGVGGNVLRQLYNDAFINTWGSGTTSSYNMIASSTEKVKEGTNSLKVKNLAGNASINARIISTSLTLNIPSKDNVALQFWLYLDSTAEAFRQNFYVALISQNGSDTTECRLPLSSYYSANDTQQWKLITIPLSEFNNNGAYYKGTNGANPAAASDFNWSNFIGAGFVSSTTGLPETVYYLDDVKYITYTAPTPLAITTDSLAGGITGLGYSSILNAIGGVAPYTWSAADLPAGLSVDPVTGELSGTPNEAGTFTTRLTVTDSAYKSMARDLVLAVEPHEALDSLPAYDATVLPDAYQTVKGWGIFPGSSSQGFDFPHKYAAQKAIFQELGITMFRQELRGTSGDADGNLVTSEIDNIVANIKAGVDNGITSYTLHVWSPPAGMKSNNNISGKNADGTPATLLPEKEEAFAQYIVKALDYIQSKGLPVPVAFSLQNEPDAVVDYQGAYYGLEQYKRVTILLRHTLDASGYSNVLLLAPETGSYNSAKYYFGNDFSELVADDDFANAVGAFTSHSYTRKTDPSSQVQEYLNNTSKFPQKDKWMTEFSTAIQLQSPTQIDRAIDAMQVFSSDLAWVGNNYWFWWLGWDSRYSINDAVQETLIEGDGIHTAVKGKLYEALSAVFHHVPVGSVVKRLSTTDSSAANALAHQSDMVAFRNGESTVALLINTSAEDKLYNLNGLTGSSAKVYSIAQSDVQQTKNVIGGTLAKVLIPARSINIVATSSADAAPPAIHFNKPASLVYDGSKYISRGSSVIISGNVDEPAEVKVNGSAVAVNSGYSFSKEVELSAGMNAIRIEATDAAGNSSTLLVNVAFDPDYLALEMDKTSDQTNNPTYIIRGKVNTPSTIAINADTVAANDDLTFEYPVTLSEGQNHFVLSATDSMGNSSEPVSFEVYCDSREPEIAIWNTENATEDSEYILSGQMNENVKSFQIYGTDYHLRPDLSFVEKLSLAEGENTLIIRAEDLFNNISTKEYKVTFHRTASTPGQASDLIYTPKAAKTVRIDGDISDEGWVMNKASKVISSKIADSNNIVNFGTLWDENNLYIAAKVYDDRLAFGSKNVWNNDCIEVFLNPTNKKAGAYSGYDKQLFIGFTLNSDSMYPNSGAAYQTAWKDFAGGYVAEIAIPWSSLGLSPAAGLEVGFDLANDDKDITENRENVIVWAGTQDNYRDTSRFGTLVLADAGQTLREGAALTGPSSAVPGQSLDLTYSLVNVTSSVYAKSVTVNYDPAVLQYIGADSLVDNFTVVGSTYGVGKIQIVEAGLKFPVSGSVDLLKLHFQTLSNIPTVTTAVYLTDVIVADQYGNEAALNIGPAVEIRLAVDKTALNDKLAEADSALRAVEQAGRIGPRWGQYPQASVDTFAAFIAAVKAVQSDGAAAQSDVNQAAESLAAAGEAFRASINTKAGIGDLAIMAAHYGETSAGSGSNWVKISMYDMDQNGELGIVDLAALARMIME